MDQVSKLYNELLEYDPSLAKDKEALLQLIEKMIANKPNIVINQTRKETFDERLAAHIASRSGSLRAPHLAGSRFAKWGFSFATLAIIVFVAGGSFLLIDRYGSRSSDSTDKDDSTYIALQNDTNRGYMQDKTTEVLMQREGNSKSDDATIEPSQMADTMILTQVDNNPHTDIFQQNTSSSLHNTRTMPMIQDKETKQASSQQSITGASNTAPMSDGAMTMMNPQKKQTVTLVFSGSSGSILTSPVLEILDEQHISATFIVEDRESIQKLERLGHQAIMLSGFAKIDSYIVLDEENSEHMSGLLNGNGIVLIQISAISQESTLLHSLIVHLKNSGYTFVELGAIEQ